MSKIKGAGAFFICLLFVLAWYLASFYSGWTLWYQNDISVRWEETSGVSPAYLSKELRWQHQDGGFVPEFVMWRTEQSQQLLGDQNDRSVTGEILEYYGDISLLYPVKFLSGYWASNERGCVIDKSVADTLWGSSEVVGRSILWNGKTWYVRGVIDGDESTAFFPAQEDNTTEFSGILFCLPKSQTGVMQAEQILNQCHLPEGRITDLGLFSWITEVMSSIPVFLMWGSLTLKLIYQIWKVRSTQLILLVTILFVLVQFLFICWAAGFPWTIPDRFLPTRWSDTSFWSELGRSIVYPIKEILIKFPSVWEQWFWKQFFYSGVFSIIAVVLLLFIFNLQYVKKAGFIFWKSIVYWGMVLILTWIFGERIFQYPPASILTMPPVWMTSQWMMDRYHKWLVLIKEQEKGNDKNEEE